MTARSIIDAAVEHAAAIDRNETIVELFGATDEQVKQVREFIRCSPHLRMTDVPRLLSQLIVTGKISG